MLSRETKLALGMIGKMGKQMPGSGEPELQAHEVALLAFGAVAHDGFAVVAGLGLVYRDAHERARGQRLVEPDAKSGRAHIPAGADDHSLAFAAVVQPDLGGSGKRPAVDRAAALLARDAPLGLTGLDQHLHRIVVQRDDFVSVHASCLRPAASVWNLHRQCCGLV